jgi:hypothetical protein
LIAGGREASDFKVYSEGFGVLPRLRECVGDIKQVPVAVSGPWLDRVHWNALRNA